jgi:REP element-mobilizing transposase RayT
LGFGRRIASLGAMPRKPLIRSDRIPYHVTARVNNREHFHLPLPQMWKIIGNECLNLHLVYAVEFHSVVMMPNHLHMLLTVPEHDLGVAMRGFMGYTTRTSNLISGRSGHLFGGRYYWSLVNSSRYYGHAYKYVYRNPVRAGLCERVEDYPYSTLQGSLGSGHLPFPLHLTRIAMELVLPSIESMEQLEWLNRPFPKEAEEMIQKGLRKREFGAIMDRKTRRPVELLDRLL